MDQFKGKLLLNGQVFAEVEGVLSLRLEKNFLTWSGAFDLPNGEGAQARVEYQLVLDDGRSGMLFVVGFDAGREYPYSFQGTGPLQ